MHYIFDVDGTLVESHTEILLPGVREWFEQTPDQSDVIDFCTNNGGTGFRWWLENTAFGKQMVAEKGIDVSKYNTEVAASARLYRIEHSLTNAVYPVGKYVCFAYQFKSGRWADTPYGPPDGRNVPPTWRADYRKPAPGMLIEAQQRAMSSETVFVGDSDEDIQAVNAAKRQGVNITFIHRDNFFS